MTPTGLARIVTALCAALLLSSCIFGLNAQPTPSPTSATPAAPARPRLELSTFQYALQTKDRIRVGVRDDAAPYSARGADGRYTGFEPDIAREIARAIWGAADDPNAHIQWVAVDDSTRVTALTGDQADIVIAGLLINDATKKVLDLTDGYYRDGQRLMVLKSNDRITELADVAAGDETVTVVKGTPWEENIRRLTNDRAKVLPLDTMEFCMQALTSGAADALTQDEAALVQLVRKDAGVKIVGKRFTDDQIGIGIKQNVRADRQGFREFVNNVLLRIVADRTWAKLYQADITPVTGDTKQLPTD